MTPMQYFEGINFLDENTIIAHAVNLTEGDLNILKKYNAKIAHNPLANTVLSSGMPHVRDFHE